MSYSNRQWIAWQDWVKFIDTVVRAKVKACTGGSRSFKRKQSKLKNSDFLKSNKEFWYKKLAVCCCRKRWLNIICQLIKWRKGAWKK